MRLLGDFDDSYFKAFGPKDKNHIRLLGYFDAKGHGSLFLEPLSLGNPSGKPYMKPYMGRSLNEDLF